MLKKRFVSLFLALAMVFGLSGQASATGMQEYISTGNENVDRVIINMFELPGYSILQDGEIDVSAEFYATMKENYERGNLVAISQYLKDNRISVSSPIIVQPAPPVQARIVSTRRVHGEGLIYVKNLLELKGNTNNVWWGLDATVVYHTNVQEVLSVEDFKMSYDLERHYGDGKTWFEPDYATYSISGPQVDFAFGVDCGIALSTYEQGTSPIYLNLTYKYRADGTWTYIAT